VSNAGFKQPYAGLTWVEILVTLAIVSVLLSAGVSHWRGLQTQYAERRLLNDVARVLTYARNQAFLHAETLVLLPRVPADGWSSGMVLEFKHPAQDDRAQRLHTWRWHYPNVHLSWHGFLGEDTLVVDHSPAQLAMNGYFLVENSGSKQVRWVVSRFGRIRAEQS
jgi:Tfp pilus assembly protein FimT